MCMDELGAFRGVSAANDRHERGVVVPVGGEIAVVGRANVDLTVRVPGLPTPGRAVYSAGLSLRPVARASTGRLRWLGLAGRPCWSPMSAPTIGATKLSVALATAGVDTRGVRQVAGAATGAAIIQVTPDGEPYVTVAVPPGRSCPATTSRRRSPPAVPQSSWFNLICGPTRCRACCALHVPQS